MATSGHHYLAGITLMLVAILLYVQTFLNTKNIVNLKGLFSLSWIGGQGIASLQLSELQSNWNIMTWVCFFLAFIFFSLGFDFKKILKKEKNNPTNHMVEHAVLQSDVVAKKVFVCMVLLTGASIGCFVLEALVVGYIPLFSKLPHAYSYFHISGVHYFTISCILIPALTVIYNRVVITKDKITTVFITICNTIAIAIPILCVSRFQLLFAVMFAVVVYLLIYKKITIKAILILFTIMILAYVLLTVARNHDITYLNGIFDMKYKKMPIFITQPYIYIANNYENFNCMVNQISTHTYGLKMLFPVLALTGLKFIFPQLTIFQAFITKKELTTLTIFYDAYYDFGVIGIAVFAFLLGFIAYKLTKAIENCTNPIMYLFYGQIAIYLALSFFTTWFSNPTTWFWIALTSIMYIYVGHNKNVKELESL